MDADEIARGEAWDEKIRAIPTGEIARYMGEEPAWRAVVLADHDLELQASKDALLVAQAEVTQLRADLAEATSAELQKWKHRALVAEGTIKADRRKRLAIADVFKLLQASPMLVSTGPAIDLGELEIKLNPSTVFHGSAEADSVIDWLGTALELESQAKRVESQSAQRAMEAGARALRLMGGQD